MQKKTNIIKVFFDTIKRIFRSRNIIIISDHKVDHVPLSGVLQVLLLVGFIGFFSGVSFITGSYMTARSTIREKDKKIVINNMEKGRISEEMDMLKRDLVRLSQNGSELNSYSKFIISQHSDQLGQASDLTGPFAANNVFVDNPEKLQDKITFLEGRINEIRNENEHLVAAIRERTDKKISYFEDVISMTGLDSDKLEHMAADDKSADIVSEKSASTAKVTPLDDESAKKEQIHGTNNQGGPFIPYENTASNSVEQELLTNVDRLITLHDIVAQLPLSQPINDAQQMSPFGKRVDPINGRWSIHPGVDLAGPVGSKIFSTNNGIVVAADHRPGYGNMVDIEHKFGIITRYAHLSKILVKEGQKVNKGQLIAIQGSTGRSTGPHLHYEVRINDRPVNPVNFLNAGDYVLEN